jgi:hypothetical protein
LLWLLAAAACAPLPDTGQRKLSSQGIRPGVTAVVLAGVGSVPERQARYRIDTPLRRQPSEMLVTLRPAPDGGYLREETVRVPETSPAEAQLVATMIRQRDGREAEVVGTDVILTGTERLDRQGRTLVSERGGVRTAWARTTAGRRKAPAGPSAPARTGATSRWSSRPPNSAASGARSCAATRSATPPAAGRPCASRSTRSTMPACWST